MKIRTRVVILLSLVGCTLGGGLYACDTGNPASPVTQGGDGGTFATGSEGGSATDAAATDGGDASETDGGDAGPSPLNGCATYTDNTTSANTVIVWSFNVTSDPNHCSKIKAGNTVTWLANLSGEDFNTHPLAPFGGDTPTPITDVFLDASVIDAADPMNPSVTVEFDGDGGFYGYHCDKHASMKGAIEVVP